MKVDLGQSDQLIDFSQITRSFTVTDKIKDLSNSIEELYDIGIHLEDSNEKTNEYSIKL